MLEMEKIKKNKAVLHPRFLETAEIVLRLIQQYDIQSPLARLLPESFRLCFVAECSEIGLQGALPSRFRQTVFRFYLQIARRSFRLI